MGRAFEYRKAAKMKRWGMMSRVFPKLGNRITAAAKDGGSDPEMNPSLRTAIQNAKAANMPKDNILSAIKRATSSDYKSMTEVNYEGKGPHGVLIFVECATDNTTRTVANVKSYFNKAGGAIVPTGSLEFMFERKAIFELVKTDETDIEELELELIDAGLEEIEEVDDQVIITADYKSFGNLTAAIEALKLEINKSVLERFPTSPQQFTEEQMVDIDKMLDKLHNDDDVQEVFTNIG
ncbi:MAG: YebC/PmpR family DNA-binding transcriptional regulator [Bacteroidetes bacterium 4572_112]|nr:MAG: YebC/PmpR family DNA-binding transcriptional regulator [Bacteroidetes bacterium 4572_112]